MSKGMQNMLGTKTRPFWLKQKFFYRIIIVHNVWEGGLELILNQKNSIQGDDANISIKKKLFNIITIISPQYKIFLNIF